jgi:hypothetical protein
MNPFFHVGSILAAARQVRVLIGPALGRRYLGADLNGFVILFTGVIISTKACSRLTGMAGEAVKTIEGVPGYHRCYRAYQTGDDIKNRCIINTDI